jgi:hypothetical protein
MREYWQSVVGDWAGDWTRNWVEDWRPVSRYSVAAWLFFYAVFLLYAFSKHGEFLFIDLANLVVHEGGHLLFGWFGSTLGLWGGTILQWLAPFLLAAYFFTQRQTTAFAFCAFFFFENWLYTSTYMADARAMVLPLVTTGDSDFIEHDWHTIFSSLGVLQYDTKIAAVLSFLGWCGMLATVAWLVQRSLKDAAGQSATKPSAV